MMNSMIIETETRTKQTTATAHVGVCSKDLPALPPAMFGASLPLPSYVSKLARIYTAEKRSSYKLKKIYYVLHQFFQEMKRFIRTERDECVNIFITKK